MQRSILSCLLLCFVYVFFSLSPGLSQLPSFFSDTLLFSISVIISSFSFLLAFTIISERWILFLGYSSRKRVRAEAEGRFTLNPLCRWRLYVYQSTGTDRPNRTARGPFVVLAHKHMNIIPSVHILNEHVCTGVRVHKRRQLIRVWNSITVVCPSRSKIMRKW